MKKPIILSLIAVVLAFMGCSKDSPTEPSQPKLGNDMIQSIEAATKSGNFTTPLDATPDPDGNIIYFTATGPSGKGLFRVSASGGEGVAIKTGAPFVAPRGLAMATNGQQIYVADPQAINIGGKPGNLCVCDLAGNPSTLRGTEGTAPTRSGSG